VATILSAAEAATVLRCDDDDHNMIDLLPQVDTFIRLATGRDWTGDSPVHPAAKAAARMLLVLWYENPGMFASGTASLNFGLLNVLIQLEALKGRYFTFQGGYGAGAVSLLGAKIGDTVESLIGKIGLSGDQSSLFESVITVDDQIQQLSSIDLSACWVQVYLVPVGEL
jgi:hypothetical protein